MTERELERRAQRRLAVLRHVEEVSGNVAATCRYYGISLQCYYGWLRRYEAAGLDGLKDRSSRPHHSPRMTQAEVVFPALPISLPAATTSPARRSKNMEDDREQRQQQNEHLHRPPSRASQLQLLPVRVNCLT